MVNTDRLHDEQERHTKAFEIYYGLGATRSLKTVATRLGVSLNSVKLWSRSFNWQERIRKRDAQVARKAADTALQTGAAEIERNQKIVEMALVKLARSIAEGKCRYQLADLDRLMRLRTFLSGQLDQRDPDRPKTREEFLDRYLEYFKEEELDRMIEFTECCMNNTETAAKIDGYLRDLAVGDDDEDD